MKIQDLRYDVLKRIQKEGLGIGTKKMEELQEFFRLIDQEIEKRDKEKGLIPLGKCYVCQNLTKTWLFKVTGCKNAQADELGQINVQAQGFWIDSKNGKVKNMSTEKENNIYIYQTKLDKMSIKTEEYIPLICEEIPEETYEVYMDTLKFFGFIDDLTLYS